MLKWKKVKIRNHELGLVFKDGEFKRILRKGKHRLVEWFRKVRVDVVSMRQPFLEHEEIEQLVESNRLARDAVVIRLMEFERAFVWIDGRFDRVLSKGHYVLWNRFRNVQVSTADMRKVHFQHGELNQIAQAKVLGEDTILIDLQDHQRGLVWVDGRFERILSAGLHVLWQKFHQVKVEVLDARNVRFEHDELEVILKSTGAAQVLEAFNVAEEHVGVLYRDGKFVESLAPGQYAFWKDVAKAKVFQVDMREHVLDVAGQEIMTADKVTLRLNAVVAYRVTDARKTVAFTDDVKQSLYREVQLALRAVIGTRELDLLLSDKDSVASELETLVRRRADEFGLEIISVGIRDVILPGEMKNLLNQVTEAKKAAEANLIARREETAAMRSQANTAKLLENNPALMRLRELEVLEKISANSKLNVVLGEKGLADRVVNLL